MSGVGSRFQLCLHTVGGSSIPAVLMGGLGGVLGTRLLPRPALAPPGTWEANQGWNNCFRITKQCSLRHGVSKSEIPRMRCSQGPLCLDPQFPGCTVVCPGPSAHISSLSTAGTSKEEARRPQEPRASPGGGTHRIPSVSSGALPFWKPQPRRALAVGTHQGPSPA